MPARDVSLVLLVGPGKWSHTRVRKEYVFAFNSRFRKSKVCLGEQVIDFPGFTTNLIRVIFKANVGGTNQVVSVPWNDEKRPAIALRFKIDRAFRSSRK